MRTTLDLPDDLMRRIKIRAAEENRKLKDVLAELLRTGLSQTSVREQGVQNRVVLPLIKGGHPPAPGEELTPEQLSQLLLDEEVESHLATLR